MMIQRPDDRLAAPHASGGAGLRSHDHPAGDLDFAALRRIFARRWKVVAGTVAIVTGLTLAVISLLLADVAAQVPGPQIRPDDVFVDPVPNTPFVRVRVHDGDPQRASAIARLLGERVVAESRQLRARAFKSSGPTDRSRLDAAEAELQRMEDRLVEFQLQSNLELRWREQDTRVARRPAGAVPPASNSAETTARRELYRAELGLKRLEEEYQLARSAYITELARVKQIDAPDSAAIPLVELVEGTAPPAAPVGRDRVRLTLLAFAASFLLGVAFVVLIELLAGRAPAGRPQVVG
jgi:uncharacterized protein involved in exopolysaccharide biosynthesis